MWNPIPSESLDWHSAGRSVLQNLRTRPIEQVEFFIIIIIYHHENRRKQPMPNNFGL